MYVYIYIYIYAGQFKATSPDLTLNGGLFREKYQNGLKLGIETITYPVYVYFSSLGGTTRIHFQWDLVNRLRTSRDHNMVTLAIPLANLLATSP